MKISVFVLFILYLQNPIAWGDVHQMRQNQHGDFMQSWSGTAFSGENSGRSSPPLSTKISIDSSQNPPVLYKQDAFSATVLPQRWGGLPASGSYSPLVHSHGRVWVFALTDDEWNLYSSDIGGDQAHWQKSGSVSFHTVIDFLLTRDGDLHLIETNQGHYTLRKGAFTGGGKQILWEAEVGIPATEFHDSLIRERATQPQFFDEFDIKQSGRFLSLSYSQSNNNSFRVRYRVSPSENEKYGPWSDRLAQNSISLNKEGRFLQYRLEGFQPNEPLSPDLSITYTFEEGGVRGRTSGGAMILAGTGGGNSAAGGSAFSPEDQQTGSASGAGGGASPAASGNDENGAVQSGHSQNNEDDDGEGDENPSTPGNPTQSGNDANTGDGQDQSPPQHKKNEDSKPDEDSSGSSPLPQDPSDEDNKDNPAPGKRDDPSQESSQPESPPAPPADDPSLNNEQSDPAKNEKTMPDAASPPSQDNPATQNNPSESAEEGPPSSPEESVENSNTPNEKDNASDKSNKDQDNDSSSEPEPSEVGDGGGNRGQPEGSGAMTPQPASIVSEGTLESSAPSSNPPGAEKNNPGNQDSSPAGEGKTGDTPAPSSGGLMPSDADGNNSVATRENIRDGTENSTIPSKVGGGSHDADSSQRHPDSSGNSDSFGPASPGAGEGNGDGGNGQPPGASNRPRTSPGVSGNGFRFEGMGMGGGSGRPVTSATSAEPVSVTGVVTVSTVPGMYKPTTNKWWLLLLVLSAGLYAWMRKKKNSENERVEVFSIAKDIHLPAPVTLFHHERIVRDQGWDSVVRFVPEIQDACFWGDNIVALYNRAELYEGSIPLLQEGAVQQSDLKKVAHLLNPEETSFIVRSESGLYAIAKKGRTGYAAQYWKVDKDGDRRKPTKISMPNVSRISQVFSNLGRIWVVGERSHQRVISYAPLHDGYIKKWYEDEPMQHQTDTLIAVSMGKEILYVGVPEIDPDHIWVYKKDDMKKWTPVAKAIYESDHLFFHADPKRSILVFPSPNQKSLECNLFPRDVEGHFSGRFSVSVPLPAPSRLFTMKIINGQMIFLGKDEITSTLVLYKGCVGDLLKQNSAEAMLLH
jgi:hypothetical protein